MKKYNLSDIMKRAWEIKKKANVDFGKALKFSWFIAKREQELKEEWHEPEGKVLWNIWTGYGRVRAYYKCGWMSKYWNTGKSRSHFVEM